MEGANNLSREYCPRGQYFYDIWITAGAYNGFQCTPAHIAGYAENAEILDYMVSLDIESPSFARGLEIRGFKPTNP